MSARAFPGPSLTVFGLELDRDVRIGVRGVLTGPDVTAFGNLALRAGAELEPGGRRGWHQTAYVVLTPAEARRLAGQLLDAAERGDERAQART